MLASPALLSLVSLALSPIALARPTTLSLFKRQTSTIPEACTFTCQPVQTALSSCLASSCLCTTGVLDSFVDCSECTLLNTSPTDLNASIASYQETIDAYRTTCAMASPVVNLPNVTVSAPAANATYPTASSNSSAVASSTRSSNASSTASSAVSSSATASASLVSSRTPAVITTASSTGASASASASATGGASSRFGGAGWVGTVLGAGAALVLVGSL